MCGFVGFTSPKSNEIMVLKKMLSSVSYRGPDQSNISIDDGLAVGHNRLIIVTPSGGMQPRINTHNKNILAYNGELYGYNLLVNNLQKEGVRLSDLSDTEVLFQMLHHYGVKKTLDKIDGMFAFVYRDFSTGNVFLARDRHGEKPLYYSVQNGRLFFASEIKAILRHPEFYNVDIDIQSIDQYLTFDYIPGSKTLYDGIKKVLPGELVIFNNKDIIKKFYYYRPIADVDDAKINNGLSNNEIVDLLQDKIEVSVRDRLVADVPIGVFLSGGLDSSLIAAIAGKLSPGIEAFTVKFDGSSYDESKEASQVAEKYNLKHHLLHYNDADLAKGWNDILGRMDEPFADASIIPTYLLCKGAKEHVTVALGGDGCDELFAGYPNFKAIRFAPYLQHIKGRAAKTITSMIDGLPSSSAYMSLPFVLSQLSHGFGYEKIRQSYLWMSPFANQEKQQLFNHANSLDMVFREIECIMESVNNYTKMDLTTKLQTNFLSSYLPDDILTKIDRASMYNSLEVRSPYLSSEFVKLSLSLKSNLKLNGLTTKYILRKLALKYLPSNIVYKKKHGFAPPISRLLRSNLREQVESVLRDKNNSMSSMFNMNYIEGILKEHMAGARDHRKKIWSLFVLFSMDKKI
ncbi:asparagine synthase (glutamine-hydrolyzing) [bacterium]|jgi:asparagine synthase (glutamine-hydrolysing)|nr:asparagine synthase (glutamine-hydrolyzing) [bacterium]